MRRPVMYLAGLLLATGASLALAGPAAAAGSNGNCDHPDHSFGYLGDDDADFYYHQSNSWHSWRKNSGNHTNGLIVLSHNGDSSGPSLLGPLF